MNGNYSNNVIRITKEEALDQHVDDLLKRQMSMRGDPGVTRDHGRKWYYQNWFVFLCVGFLGAVVAWALLNPYFKDYLYVQGPISKIDFTDVIPSSFGPDTKDSQVHTLGDGSLMIAGEKVYLSPGLREIRADGTTHLLRPERLVEGANVGIYVHYIPTAADSYAIGCYVQMKPPQASGTQLSLEQQHGRTQSAGLLLFPLVAGLVGLFIGATDGLVCRLPRRALLCGAVGAIVGCVGGLVSSLLANVAYTPLNHLAMSQFDKNTGELLPFGFMIQMVGRSLAWALAGMAMGLGQGIALRSTRLLIYGLLGGVIGGLLGGLLFDPIDVLLLGAHKTSAQWSRLIGFGVIGLSVGGLIGVVELLARDAWLRMTQGPLTGKEFLLFKDVMNIGSSPRSDIYLFNDPLVAEQHAVLRAVGDECEIEARESTAPVIVNTRSVQRCRLRHGDAVAIGRTMFVFQRRKS